MKLIGGEGVSAVVVGQRIDDFCMRKVKFFRPLDLLILETYHL